MRLHRTSRRRAQSTVRSAAVVALSALLTPAVVIGEVERVELDNGLTVLLSPSTSGENVALVVLYAIGEDHDPAGKCGLAHLTEHVYVTAAAGKTPSRSIDDYMQRYPDGWNAQTGSDYTVFATLFPSGRLGEELRDAAARMGDLKPTDADLKREQPRLVRELHNMYDGIPALAAQNQARMHVRPLPNGRRKGGVEQEVDRITVAEVRDWWGRYYKPRNATVALAGPFDPDEARKLIRAAFGPIARGAELPDACTPGAAQPGTWKSIPIRPNVPTAPAHACLAFAAPLPGDPDYAATLLLMNRMWHQAAAGGGVPQVAFGALDDPKLIAVSAPVSGNETPEETIERLREFIDQATTAPLQPFEKMGVRQGVGMMVGLADMPDVTYRQNPYGVAFSLGRRAQMQIDAESINKRLEALQPEEVRIAAQSVFGSNWQVAVVVSAAPANAPRGN
ncbi:MAG TPA: insulinase family protein [Phycisphaerae bacterium]|nr:insulinase family protein [Phycisphaerae bacterium]